MGIPAKQPPRRPRKENETDNDWRELDFNNLPVDLCRKEGEKTIYQIGFLNSSGMIEATNSKPMYALFQACHPDGCDTIYYYRRYLTRTTTTQSVPPNHKERMAKWWMDDSGEYTKAAFYRAGYYWMYILTAPDLECDHERAMLRLSELDYMSVTKEWFINRKSASIPPEADPEPRRYTFTDLEREANSSVVTEYRAHCDDYMAKIPGVEVMVGGLLRGVYGCGPNPKAALEDYAVKLQGTRIAINATREDRKEIHLPDRIEGTLE